VRKMPKRGDVLIIKDGKPPPDSPVIVDTALQRRAGYRLINSKQEVLELNDTQIEKLYRFATTHEQKSLRTRHWPDFIDSIG